LGLEPGGLYLKRLPNGGLTFIRLRGKQAEETVGQKTMSKTEEEERRAQATARVVYPVNWKPDQPSTWYQHPYSQGSPAPYAWDQTHRLPGNSWATTYPTYGSNHAAAVDPGYPWQHSTSWPNFNTPAFGAVPPNIPGFANVSPVPVPGSGPAPVIDQQTQPRPEHWETEHQCGICGQRWVRVHHARETVSPIQPPAVSVCRRCAECFTSDDDTSDNEIKVTRKRYSRRRKTGKETPTSPCRHCLTSDDESSGDRGKTRRHKRRTGESRSGREATEDLGPGCQGGKSCPGRHGCLRNCPCGIHTGIPTRPHRRSQSSSDYRPSLTRWGCRGDYPVRPWCCRVHWFQYM
jgi:hypothetical protein